MSDRAIARAFAAARAEGRVALIPYLTAGFPTPGASREALQRLEQGGADVLELGIPFSDPLADGPTIQRSTQIALEQGMTVRGVLDLVRESAPRVPVVLMTYLNPVLAYGLERFVSDAVRAGVSGLIVTDLPGGAAPETEEVLARSGLDLIRLVAPTTPDARVRASLVGASGFVYLIARLGVTGARSDHPPDLERHATRLRAATSLPIVAGFGIGTPAQVAEAARWVDGVVVGSAMIEALRAGGIDAAVRLLGQLMAVRRLPGAA